MHYRITFYFTLIAFFISTVAKAQYDNLKFETYSTLEGLSSSTCVEIFQDSEGYLWFGTIDGLNRYDGYTFEIYRPVLNDPHSISNNRISAIAEDGDGNLWIGTDNGLNVFQKQKEKFIRIELFQDRSNAVNRRDVINDLHFDGKTNTLWIATRNGLSNIPLDSANRYSFQDLQFKHYLHDVNNANSIDNNNITSIVADKNDNIWIITNGENLNLYNEQTENFERKIIDFPTPYILDHIPKSVLVDFDGDFWIGNDLSKLVRWDKEKNQFKILSYVNIPTPIFHMYQDRQGLIWIATDGFGVFLISKEKGLIQHIKHNPVDPFSLPNNQASHILEDKNGTFWIATYNKGVSKLALSKSSFGHYFHQSGNPKSLSSYIAQSVLEDKNRNLWIGTDGGGLNLFNEKNRTFKHYYSDPNNEHTISSDKILYLTESHDQSIWVCTWDGGINKFNPQTEKAKRFLHDTSNPYSVGQNTVWCAIEDSKKRLWLGTQTAGLNLFDPNTEKFYVYMNIVGDSSSLLSNFVFSNFIDSNNRLFVGTSLGLNVANLSEFESFIPENIDFKTVKENHLQGYRINYIFEDHIGNIWIGSDLGLHKLTNDLHLVQSYTIKEGMPSNLVLGITEDDEGFIWSTTKSGLSRLNPTTGNVKNYNIHDGLQGMEFQSKSIYETHDGRIVIGGINGFNLFHPSDISNASDKVAPVFTKFRLNNKIVSVGDSINNRVLLFNSISEISDIELKYYETYIGIEFVALHYENPERVQYSYKMIGLDEDYVEVGTNKVANYSNLPPGDYTFEVRSSLDADWEQASVTSFNIKVSPPPWLTWWAFVLYGLSLIAVFWAGIKYYARLVSEEKEHELDQQKLQFFINVSHEFRTPLTLILNPINKMISSFGDPQEVKDSALTIQRSATRLLNLVNQLLDFRKLDLGKDRLNVIKADVLNYSKDIYLLFRDLAKAKDIRFYFKSSLNELSTVFDPDKFEKILTNLLSNALKFTDPGGTVTISLSRIKKSSLIKRGKVKEVIEIRVSDTGLGFKKEQMKDVFNRFFHSDSMKTGTGIGLNFTKSLVELHGGAIAVESEFNKGSTFIIHLPLETKLKKSQSSKVKEQDISDYKLDLNLLKSVEYDMSITDRPNSIAEIAEANCQGLNQVVLIVEDNRELRVHLKKELGQLFKVKEAVNGADGLKMVKKHFPDIVISDVMMPEMDGFEMCRRIKSEVEICHIPVILLTARSLEEDRIEGYKTGADEYIPKPFNMNVLMARINNLLEMKKRVREKFTSMRGMISASEITSNTLDEAFLDSATKIILDNISNPDFGLDQLLKNIGTSRSQFFRKINSLTGQNPSHFIRTIRLKYASELLTKNLYSIKEIAYNSGFNSTAYFSKTFRGMFGVTPNEYSESIK